MSRLLKTGSNRITQSYESHVAKANIGQAWARGVDIVKNPSLTDTITAHTAGTVIKVMTGQVTGKNDPEGFGYGNYVMIAHGNTYVTLYAHLENVYVKAGDTVSEGTAIGVMGNTGNSFGAHLHFEVRKYLSDPKQIKDLHNTAEFTWINPETYLDADLPVRLSASAAVSGSSHSNAAASGKTYYRVQTGSFEILANAVRQANGLKKNGFPAIIKKSGRNYRVQVGAYEIKQNAERSLTFIKKAGYPQAYITLEDGSDIRF